VTDVELIKAIKAGDETALETMYRRYLPLVWRYAYARVWGDVHAAEDVTSETFLAVVRGIRTIVPDRGSLAGWVVGIARHKVADHTRRASRSESVPLSVDVPTPDKADGPFTSLERSERRAAIAKVLENMPADDRVALESRYLDGLPVREIAAQLGRTEKAAEAVLYRARRLFRQRLEGRLSTRGRKGDERSK
jgi:RNA polymerase sigma-70 factor (ECF subfamily)